LPILNIVFRKGKKKMDPRIYDDDALALLYPTANAQSRQGVFVSRALQSQTYGNLGMAAEAEV
jgi:hypothetical protein